ncbi:MAG: penicillin-binding protein 1A [Pseudomonadota bacterium]
MIAITVVFLWVEPSLPSIKNAASYQLDTPLKIYSSDNKLIAEFGESKREPLPHEQIPLLMKQAIISAEDSRFYQHPGVDYQGILRAVVNLLMTGKKGQGGSTITMQVARNFFLSRKKTYTRKIREIFLALKLERHFDKEKILELYLNKIFLGHRSYGIATAAKTYYGKPINKLELQQFAMLAGLPKAPSKFNPLTNIKRATLRRDYILRRMVELGYISNEAYNKAKSTPDNAELHTPIIELKAPYIAEMARNWMINQPQFKNDIYTAGYKVYTSIDSGLQNTAINALHQTLMDYEHRHGYKGAIKQVIIPAQSIIKNKNKSITIDTKAKFKLIDELKQIPVYGHLQTALVVAIVENKKLKKKKIQAGFAFILLKDGSITKIKWKQLSWAKKYISDTRYAKDPTTIAQILTIGDIIYIEPLISTTSKTNEPSISYQLAQLPEVSGAIVSVQPRTGKIIALTGGFDFYQSKFNRITQAKRQPGSNFKPFIYSAALNKGYTAASLINDAPVVFKDKKLEGSWRPSNYSGKFFGPTRLRKALYKSRNMVSIRLLMGIGVNYTLDYVKKFSFDPQDLPHNLSLALGSANVTPLQIVHGYSIFANGGYNIKPWFIKRVDDSANQMLYQQKNKVACSDYYAKDLCPEDPLLHAQQTVSSDNVYLMSSILQDVIKRGTGRKALSLKRQDIGGKTGTTNEQVDAWFSGYNRDFATTSWVGFDTPRSMGRYETGGKAALPMWIRFMQEALKQSPEKALPVPENIISVKIDAQTAQLAGVHTKKSLFEYFIKNTEPEEKLTSKTTASLQESIDENIEEELF